MTPRRQSPDDSRLAGIQAYVEHRGERFSALLNHLQWDMLEDDEKELVCFRLKDKTSFPHHGVALAVDLDSLQQTDERRLHQVVGEAFLEWLSAGLPLKDPRQPYLTVFIDV